LNITDDDILAIFIEETGVDRARLVPSATLASLDIASLDIIGVSFAIEDKYGFVVEAEAFAKCETLHDVLEMIKQVAQNSATAS
jgi:acyl carrier protein